MDYAQITRKKQQLDALRPFPPELVQNLEHWFRVELTYTSNAIEGNTLSRQETALVLDEGLTVGGKSLKDHLEAINHADAMRWMQQELVQQTIVAFTENHLLKLHAFILKGIDDLHAGRYRSVAVRIAGSRVILPNPLKVPALMREFFGWLHQPSELHPIALAALAHYKLVSIHPFVDGNGRCARLLMNLLLSRQGYPPAVIQPEERLFYLNSLEKAQLGGSLDEYHALILKAVDRSLDIYLDSVERPMHLPSESKTLLRIGALSKQTNESVATLRYWTKEGLLTVTDTTPAGYQLYDKTAILRAKQIRSLQQQRYTLKEIGLHLKTE